MTGSNKCPISSCQYYTSKRQELITHSLARHARIVEFTFQSTRALGSRTPTIACDRCGAQLHIRRCRLARHQRSARCQLEYARRTATLPPPSCAKLLRRRALPSRESQQCPHCQTTVLATSLAHHMRTKTCQAFRAAQHCDEEEDSGTLEPGPLTVNGQPLAQVTSFRYLGRILDATDNDATDIAARIAEARRAWCAYATGSLQPRPPSRQKYWCSLPSSRRYFFTVPKRGAARRTTSTDSEYSMHNACVV